MSDRIHTHVEQRPDVGLLCVEEPQIVGRFFFKDLLDRRVVDFRPAVTEASMSARHLADRTVGNQLAGGEHMRPCYKR